MLLVMLLWSAILSVQDICLGDCYRQGLKLWAFRLQSVSSRGRSADCTTSHTNEVSCFQQRFVVSFTPVSGFNRCPSQHAAAHGALIPVGPVALWSHVCLLLALKVWGDDGGGRASYWPPGCGSRRELPWVTWLALTQQTFAVMWHGPPHEEGVVKCWRESWPSLEGVEEEEGVS